MDWIDVLTLSGALAWLYGLWRLTQAARLGWQHVRDLPRRVRWAVLGPRRSRQRSA